MAKLLTERFAFAGTVGEGDKANVIEGVLLCGATSANRRRYKPEAFAGNRVERYNGRPVYLNHGDNRSSRDYRDQIGTVENARLNAAGLPVGDVILNPKKPFAEAVLWDAKHKPKACGMSHVAQCETVRAKDGWEEITEIVSVESVDIVTDPATTKGFREHRGTDVPKISLKTFVERFGAKWGATKWAAATKVCEEFGAMADTPSIDEPPADAEPGDLKTALMSALAPMLEEAFDSGDSTKLIAALKDFIKLHAKHTGKETPAEPAADEAAAKESKAKPTDPLAVLSECKALSYEPGIAELKTLCLMPPADRIAHVREQLAKVANSKAEKPRSGGRTQVAEQTNRPAGAPKDVTEFMSRITR